MNSHPLITIIVPSFNAEKSIAECLASFTRQTFTDFNVLVMDGFSSDRTLDIVQSFTGRDSRMACFSERDNGIYDAMNKGILRATGEWILFMGADDHLYNQTVLKDVQGVLKASPSDMVYGNVKVAGHAVWANDGDIYDGAFTVEKLFSKNICHQGIFYRRSIFTQIGNYNINYKIAADWDLNHRAFAYSKVEFHNQIISYFYAGGESSQLYKNDRFSSEEIVLKLKAYHGTGYFNKLYKIYAWVFYNLAYKYLVERSYFKSFYFLFFGVWHTGNRMTMLKNYFYNFLGRNKDLRAN